MRHAIITAGTKGLGKKVTEQFLNQGCTVTATYRNDDQQAEKLLQENAHLEGRLHLVQADVTHSSDLVKLVQETIERYGRVDYLINNAGPYVFERKKLADYTTAEWDEMIRGNLDAAFHLFKHVIPYMRDQQFGRIINYGFQGAGAASGWLYRSAFAAAKVGLVSLTKTIAFEEAEHGVTSNMICPGSIAGEMKEASISESKQQPDPATPVGRSGTGEDIARLIEFLCQEDSDMITGAVYEATGGIDVIHRYR
ncbi:SDR family oxidoreductase [Thalassobacillus sp. CUG 92003]|uniref:SDR family oxidoreductase n=1 Tax=Thalassobacillus sp. CUG 92003 TaxID=2736641 RepID=UPI0015E679E1|nr:SDR family oxidoreductase [Thalassobacillus sp. CUG 92003]